jgi:hypothetical protein
MKEGTKNASRKGITESSSGGFILAPFGFSFSFLTPIG